jgi:hypothetical protein
VPSKEDKQLVDVKFALMKGFSPNCIGSRSDRLRNTQGFLTKNVKEIFWDLKFLSEVTGCRKTQGSDHTGSTVRLAGD